MGAEKLYNSNKSVDVVGNKQADIVGNIVDNPYKSYAQKEYENMIDNASLEECQRLYEEIQKLKKTDEKEINNNSNTIGNDELDVLKEFDELANKILDNDDIKLL